MYHELFRASTEVIELLQAAQCKAEEILLSADEHTLVVLRADEGDETLS